MVESSIHTYEYKKKRSTDYGQPHVPIKQIINVLLTKQKKKKKSTYGGNADRIFWPTCAPTHSIYISAADKGRAFLENTPSPLVLEREREEHPPYLNRAASNLLHGRNVVLRAHVDSLAIWDRRRVVPKLEGLLADNAVDLGEHFGEGVPHVHGFKGGGLHEETVLPLGKCLGVFGGNRPQMAKIRLVAHEHDDDIGVCMGPQLLQPPLHIFKRDVACDVVDEQSAHSSPVVGTGYGPVSS